MTHGKSHTHTHTLRVCVNKVLYRIMFITNCFFFNASSGSRQDCALPRETADDVVQTVGFILFVH